MKTYYLTLGSGIWGTLVGSLLTQHLHRLQSRRWSSFSHIQIKLQWDPPASSLEQLWLLPIIADNFPPRLFHDRRGGSPHGEWPGRKQKRIVKGEDASAGDLIMEMTPSPPPPTFHWLEWSRWIQPTLRNWRLHQSINTSQWGSLGLISETLRWKLGIKA